MLHLVQYDVSSELSGIPWFRVHDTSFALLSCLVPFWSFELPKWLRSGKLASLRCWQHSVDTTASADTLPVESGLFRRDVDSTSKRALHRVIKPCVSYVWWSEASVLQICPVSSQLKVVPSIQPRALSITMDRATGIIHFLVGGIGVSWAFTVCRSLLAQAFRKLSPDRRAKIYFACFRCLQFLFESTKFRKSFVICATFRFAMNVPKFFISRLVFRNSQNHFRCFVFKRKVSHFREISRNSRKSKWTRASSQNARYLCLWEGWETAFGFWLLAFGAVGLF